MAGLGAAALAPVLPASGRAQGAPSVTLQGKADTIALRDGPPTPVWSLHGPELRFKRGETAEVAFANELPTPAVLNWRGIDGIASAEPLTARPPVAAGAKQTLQLPLRHAGTFLCDFGLLGDGQARPTRSRALVVRENEAVSVDRDEVFLIEDWRVLPDGSAIAPGLEPKDAVPAFTVNGRTSLEISARTNERVRLRFISACQRTVIATKMENYEVRVMAVCGQPAEPFQARSGALVLAPGGRADVFIDVALPAGTSTPILLHDGKEARPVGKIVVSSEPPIRPAPLPPAAPLRSNGLPERIELKGATRVDLALGTPQGDWVAPASFVVTAAPAFRVKTGRTVVLALTNRAAMATVFHLHGHHFRLLDRLDDGWKPYWLDTLAIEPGQTQRIAFLAEHAGRYLIESVATDWAAPRLVRWYAVE
ncbi:multicopper oxidase family protein [Bradyrhizobium hereditatis]|uniref:multicopper oxidase family protein n=1 Tax=Bradyrhizobium hereditatis TaxID=2821405 RepID=UPI001CE393CA|nr:multicopper oxidase domain-containing protein [Bradyrhizobium hereditatis]